MSTKHMKLILIAAMLMLASCCDDSGHDQQPEAEKPGRRFVVEDIDSAHRYRVAYAITDTKTGRVYLMNSKGGAPVEVSP